MNHFDSWWWSSHLEALNKRNNQWDFWTDSVKHKQTAVMDPVLKSPDLLQQTAGQRQWHHWRTREVLTCLKDRRWRSVCVWLLCLWSLVEKRQRELSSTQQDTREQLQPSGSDRRQAGRRTGLLLWISCRTTWKHVRGQDQGPDTEGTHIIPLSYQEDKHWLHRVTQFTSCEDVVFI